MHRDMIVPVEENRLERLERPPVITLTTDFGLYDGYVGTMKGVIHTLVPDAKIVDISHEVAPQQIHEGAFILYRAYRYFPASGIHMAVVDPGVGSSRRPIVLVTRHGIFVGPDNGIFTYVLGAEQTPIENADISRRPAWAGGMWSIAPNWANDEPADIDGDTDVAAETAEDPPHFPSNPPRAYHLINPDYWLSSVSATFHGRDIFAPVAAHLASGAHPDRMGEAVPLESLIKLPIPAPRAYRTGRSANVVGQIMHVDRFGNIITNLPERLLRPLLEAATKAPVIEIGDHRINGLSKAYADVREGQPLALIGSEGLIEIAVRNASAAQRMKVRIGDPVRIVVNNASRPSEL